MRSGQVCTPVHHLPARLRALSVNFLSRKLTFSSCKKQKEEKCVNIEKSGSSGRKLLPQPKEVATVSPGQASPQGVFPGRPYTVPQTWARRRRAAFPTKHQCAIALARSKPCSCHFSPPQKISFSVAKMFSEALHHAQAGETMTHGWQHRHAERPKAALRGEVSPLIALGAGPLGPSSSPRALGPPSAPQEHRCDGMLSRAT